MLPSIEPSPNADRASSPSHQRAPDTPDCLHYTRTGSCNYGLNCRFNHPPLNQTLESGLSVLKEDYPERIGEPECQFYLKTGACKFGSACKYHHPKEKAGITGKAFINEAGYPLRLGEKNCAYYIQTGTCKFGMSCKFNHPQPICLPMEISGRPAYTSAAAAQMPLSLTVSSWESPGGSHFPGFPPQRPCFLPMFVPSNGFISMLSLTTSQGSMRPIMHPSLVEMKHQRVDGTATYEGVSENIHGPYIACNAATNYLCSSLIPKNSIHPERPGQPECKYFIKTGDCKFGTSCWFDHPKKWNLMPPSCVLSPMGLPQRPGIGPCSFYMRYGTCKFGPSCRYDHPWSSSTVYSPPIKSLIKCPFFPYPLMHVVPRPVQSSVDTLNIATTIEDNEREKRSFSSREKTTSNSVFPVAEHSGMGAAKSST